MRSLRLLFLISLFVSSVAFVVQVAHMGVGTAVTLACAAVQVLVFALRLVEFGRARPQPLWADLLELAGVFTVLTQVTEVQPVISTLFMSVLFRAAIGPLPRLMLSQAGYLGVWMLAVVLTTDVEPIVGAMMSLPITSLMVYGMRTLMTKLQEQQSAQTDLLKGVLNELPFPVVVTDAAGAVVMANPAVMTLIGHPGHGAVDLAGLRMEDTEGRPVDLPQVVANCAATGRQLTLKANLTRPDGSVARLEAQTVPMVDHLTQDSGVVLTLLDVTLQRSYEEHLHKVAYFDLLTGLPNRRMLFERLEVAHGRDLPYAVLLIDLNDFKIVNDTLGHKIGDEVLAGTAARIRSVLDDSATVARLGGDEFAVFLPHAAQPEAEAAAQAVRDSFTEVLELSCGPVQGSGTVGVAVAAPGDTPDHVLEKADQAMYEAKRLVKRNTRSPQGQRNSLQS